MKAGNNCTLSEHCTHRVTVSPNKHGILQDLNIFFFLYSLYNFFGIKIAGYVVQKLLILKLQKRYIYKD